MAWGHVLNNYLKDCRNILKRLKYINNNILMKFFSKIDKSILLTLIVLLVVALFVGFVIYKYITNSSVNIQNYTGGVQTENSSPENLEDVNKDIAPTVQIETQGGTLTICVDKCGDGECQITDLNCIRDNSLNCICPETKQECSQDCK